MLLLDEHMGRVAADRQSAVLATVMGGELDIPDWYVERARFDEALCAAPQEVEPDSPDAILRRALGLSERRQ